MFVAKDWININYPIIDEQKEYKLSDFFKQFKRTLTDLCNHLEDKDTNYLIERMIVTYEGLLAMTGAMLSYNDEHMKKCLDEESTDAHNEQERLVQLTIRSRTQLGHIDKAYQSRQLAYKNRADEITYNNNILRQFNIYCVEKLKTMKNLHILIPLIDNLEQNCKLNKNNILNQFKQTYELFNSLNNYHHFPLVKTMCTKIDLCKDICKNSLTKIWIETYDKMISDYSKTEQHITQGVNLPTSIIKLKEICELIDLFSDNELRNQINEIWIKDKLHIYKTMIVKYNNIPFDTALNKQFAYLLDEIKDQTYQKIFPKKWKAFDNFVKQWFECAKPYFNSILKEGERKAIENNNLAVATKMAEKQDNRVELINTGTIVFNFKDIMLKTILFENMIAEQFIYTDFHIQGYLSAEFNPYMHYLISNEKAKFDAFIDSVDTNSSWALNTNGVDAYFTDADKLLFMIKGSMSKYGDIKFNNQMIQEYQNAIINYLNLIYDYLPDSNFNPEKIHIICASVNTVDIILSRYLQLQEIIHINAENQLVNDLCIKINCSAFDKLAKTVIELIKPSIYMMKELKDTNEHQYINNVIYLLNQELVSKSKVANFQILCQYIVKSFFQAFTDALKKPCVKITDRVCQELLSDSNKLKIYLLNTVTDIQENKESVDIFDFSVVIKTDAEIPIKFKHYAKLVIKELMHIEKLLHLCKLSGEQVINTLKNNSKDINIYDVLNMKGISSSDQEKLVKEYNAKVADSTKWIPIKESTLKSKFDDLKKAVLL